MHGREDDAGDAGKGTRAAGSGLEEAFRISAGEPFPPGVNGPAGRPASPDGFGGVAGNLGEGEGSRRQAVRR